MHIHLCAVDNVLPLDAKDELAQVNCGLLVRPELRGTASHLNAA